MQNKSLITGVALSAIAIVGIVTAVNVSNMQKASSTAAVGNGNTPANTLTIYKAGGTGATPIETQVVSVDQLENVYLAWNWKTPLEPKRVTKLTLKASGNSIHLGDIKNIKVYAKSGVYTAFQPTAQLVMTAAQFNNCTNNVCSYMWTATNNLLPFTINPGVGATVWIKADIGLSGTANLGDDFFLSVANDGVDVVAVGNTPGMTYTGGIANQNGAHTYIAPCQVVVTGVSPTVGSTQFSSIGPGTQIARFKVTNNCSSQVALTTAKFTDLGSHTGTSARYTLLSSDQNSSNYAAHALATSTTDFVSGAYTFSGIGGTHTLINGGSYRYITLSITTVTGVVSGDTFNLSVRETGDWKFSATEANLGFDGNIDGDLGDTIQNLFLYGKPLLGTYMKQ